VVELGKGRHSGTGATVDHLFGEWIVELRRKGRSPNTIHGYKKTYERNIRATLGLQARHEGVHEDAYGSLRSPPGAGTGSDERLSDPSVLVLDLHPSLSMGLA